MNQPIVLCEFGKEDAVTMLCPCGCGLAAKDQTGAPRRGHEEAVRRQNIEREKAFNRDRPPRVNGTADRRARAKARKLASAQN